MRALARQAFRVLVRLLGQRPLPQREAPGSAAQQQQSQQRARRRRRRRRPCVALARTWLWRHGSPPGPGLALTHGAESLRPRRGAVALRPAGPSACTTRDLPAGQCSATALVGTVGFTVKCHNCRRGSYRWSLDKIRYPKRKSRCWHLSQVRGAAARRGLVRGRAQAHHTPRRASHAKASCSRLEPQVCVQQRCRSRRN